MKIAISSDHGGFELKTKLFEYLSKKGHEILDFGNHVYDAKDDYPDFAMLTAQAIGDGRASKGIILCGSGVGACITANKFKGVRACLCHDTYSAHQGVEHDDMNVICIGARIIGENLAYEIVDSFIDAKFINEERFTRRLNKILNLEK